MVNRLIIFAVAFALRIFSSIITTVTKLNPESTGDATVFVTTAASISIRLQQGDIMLWNVLLQFQNFGGIHRQWGLFLSFYWLLPGPSIFYARVGNALLGSFAIYNIYIIGRYYHSHRAGVLAVLPIIFYPSVIAIHSTVLREAIILFGVTTAVRLVITPAENHRRWLRYTIAAAVLYVAYIYRSENYVIYASSFITGLFVSAVTSGYLYRKLTILSAGALLPLSISSWSFIRSGLEYLSYIRNVRGGGRTDYLLNIIPQTLPELIAFSWIGAAYFLYAPFPWMIETIPDLMVSIESIITMGFTVATLWGIRIFARKNKPATAGLVIGFILAIVLYGVGTVNYGTGMRHRQMFTWIVFLFGGIGVAEHVDFRKFSVVSSPQENKHTE